jgi:hypothetical protein
MGKKKWQKPQNQNPPSGNHHAGDGNERKISGDVRVHGIVEVGFPEKLVERYEAAANKTRPYENKHYWLNVWTLFFVFITAGATSWQACLIREQFTSDQRPFVWVHGVDPVTFDKGNGQLAMNFYVVNSGKTPALKEYLHRRLFYGENAVRDAYDWFDRVEPGMPKGGGAVPPGGVPDEFHQAPVWATARTPADKRVTQSEFDDAMAHERGIVIAVRIGYEDVGGNTYTTDFCMFRSINGSMPFCDEHNTIK